jgi:lipopolysaccharide assembly outer membrane protein LptD (OstA)
MKSLSRTIFASLLAIDCLFIAVVSSVFGAEENPIKLDHSDTYEFVRGLFQDTVYVTGSVEFTWGGGKLFADSAFWVKGEIVHLDGHVHIQDSLYDLSADEVIYDVKNKLAFASGQTVTIFSDKDSMMAIGTNAYYSRDSLLFRMSNRPTAYFNYPDSARVVRIDADNITFAGDAKIGYADGKVVINQQETRSEAGRAIMYTPDDILALYDNPIAIRRDSEIKGDTLIAYSENSVLKKIYVEGKAEGNFKEPSGKDTTISDISNLKAAEIEFNFKDGYPSSIVASDQAYSFYAPGTKDSLEIVKNNCSGDTIKLFIENKKLLSVQVIGGAEGEYLNGKYKNNDSGRMLVEDTVRYRSDFIDYSLNDSTISLTGTAAVANKNLSLTAHRIKYRTDKGLVNAFDDSTRVDTSLVYIPVVLKDGSEELIGSYLEYSMKTERGMLTRSKTEYQEAYYRGRELFREKKNTYYVENASYTSCNMESPHYHFRAGKMKMLQGDRIIARPVVFYIEKVPLMIVPYYIFSIKPGRHSGLLPFRIGNFERGAGSITNIGYYWAASQYWDLQTSMDYYENYGFTYHGTVRYAWRYNLSGSLTGSYSHNSQYDASENYMEAKEKRWQVLLDHSQTFSPTFSLKASGNFVSDKNYYTDFSTDLDERLNRQLRSQVSLSKQWQGASLSAQMVHSVYLDAESRTDELPTASLSLTSFPIFGSPDKDGSGRKWYHDFYFGYSVGLRNYSSRTTDTAGFRSRKEFITLNHTPTIRLASLQVFKYLKINPSFSYQETWYKIFETDQSQEAGIDSKQLYRRFAYGASVSMSTDLYGTVQPNLWGVAALRHVLTPSLGFSWAPEITRHADIKSYTGIGGGGSKQRTMSFSLHQLFQAKVKSGEVTKSYDLLNVNSSLSYNFEATGRKFSQLSTSAQTSLLKNISLSASMTHELYEPGTDKLKWQSPYLVSFNISTSFSTSGIMSQYGAADTSGRGEGNKKQNWNFTLTHYYSESGRGQYFSKSHSLSFNANFNLGPNWKINYRQTYNVVQKMTISRRIEVERDLHCWKGYFYWIPDGSNKGYYFRLNIISIPDIKFEKSESGIKGAFL